MSIHQCPCGSALAYDDCCAPYHQGLVAPNAEALMRSRYSAYVRKDIDYIIDTTLPIQQPLLAVDAIRAWAAQTKWQRLMILSHNPKIGKGMHRCIFVRILWRQTVSSATKSARRSYELMMARVSAGIFWIQLCHAPTLAKCHACAVLMNDSKPVVVNFWVKLVFLNQ